MRSHLDSRQKGARTLHIAIITLGEAAAAPRAGEDDVCFLIFKDLACETDAI